MRAFLLILTALLSTKPVFSNGYEGLVPVGRDEVIAGTRNYNKNQFFKLIKGREFKGIELIVSNPKKASTGGSFGHAALHFIDGDTEVTNDLIISFEMEVLNNKTMVADAIISSNKSILPYSSTLSEFFSKYYLDTEIRFKRFIIPSDDTKIQNLINAINMYLDAPSLLGRYHFIKNNCLTAALRSLSRAGYNLELEALIDIPSLLEKTSTMRILSGYPHLKLIGTSDIDQLISIIKIHNDLVMSGDQEEIDVAQFALKQQLEQATDIEISKLNYFWNFKWGSKPRALKDELEKRSISRQSYEYEELIGYRKIPDILYKDCNSNDRPMDCQSEQEREASLFFGEKEFTKSKYEKEASIRLENIRNNNF